MNSNLDSIRKSLTRRPIRRWPTQLDPCTPPAPFEGWCRASVRRNESRQLVSGTLSYSSLATFAANALDRATQTATLPLKRQRKTQVFSYVQDEYKFKANLTVNLG